jgi:hypothetical protein
MPARKPAGKTTGEDTILIRGQEIPVSAQYIEQDRLRFYAENPRVYSVVRGDGKTPTQEDIQRRLLDMEHVKELVQDIRLNDGLIEPLIVRDGTYEVLEGNSRLAAYRFLAKSDAIKWGRIRCSVLPSDIDDALVFALLGQFHIKGKKDWQPFEQAGFLYRRSKKHNANTAALAIEIGISEKRVKHLVETYQFMLENEEDDINRWSYYDEYLKSNKIKRARSQYPEMDSLVVKKIRNQEIERAMDLRDELPVICNSSKALKKFISGNLDFSEAHDIAVQAGGDTVHLKTVKKFRNWITRPQVENHLLEYEGKIRGSVLFELRKIESRLRHVLKKLDKNA